MDTLRSELDETFVGATLDPDVWFPYYLPHWSSRAGSAATWHIEGDGLHLTIPADQPTWCPDTHDTPLRVSCVQTGSFAGPAGSPIGQQPFRSGLVVAEEQPTMWGYTPWYGTVEVQMRMTISPRSMAAFWMSGIEDQPSRSAEICVAEVFGDAIRPDSTDVGIGLHRFRDPAIVEDFATEALAIDVSELHTYGVEWEPEALTFTVDGHVVRHLHQSPAYPVQLMLGVFDFPDKASSPGADAVVPELVVTSVRGHPLDPADPAPSRP